MGFKTKITKLHYNKSAKGGLFNLLKFGSYFYGMGSLSKNVMYEKGILKPKKVDAYVISVGNLTTGGVGKTPVVAQIAQYYIDKGENVAIVSRGYGAKLSNKNVNVISDGEKVFFSAEQGGDEPVWLGDNVKGACVITSKNRYKASKYAIEKFGATKIILDDGFQHRKLHRDMDIVLIDSEMGFGNENLLPAGPLREGLEAFSRIDKLVVVSKNTDHTRAEKYAKIMMKKLKKQTAVCYTEPDFAYNITKPEEKLFAKVGPPDLPDGNNIKTPEVGRAFLPDDNETTPKVVAFSAIGQPQQFYRFLKDFEVVKTVDFDDHHKYSQKDIEELLDVGCIYAPVNYITTEKDAVKLVGLDTGKLNIFALKLKTKLDVATLLGEQSGKN